VNRYIRNSVQRKQAGISVIEVLISLIIISAGLLSVSKFQGQLFQSATLATQRSEAQALAQQVIDAYRAARQTTLTTMFNTCPISGAASCTGTEWTAPSAASPTPIPSASGNEYTVTWKMSRTATSATAATQRFVYRVEVNINWTNAQGAQTHQAYALIAPSA
jgi:type IV pilus modification protein PilV